MSTLKKPRLSQSSWEHFSPRRMVRMVWASAESVRSSWAPVTKAPLEETGWKCLSRRRDVRSRGLTRNSVHQSVVDKE